MKPKHVKKDPLKGAFLSRREILSLMLGGYLPWHTTMCLESDSLLL
jgi:hypothetical protein